MNHSASSVANQKTNRSRESLTDKCRIDKHPLGLSVTLRNDLTDIARRHDNFNSDIDPTFVRWWQRDGKWQFDLHVTVAELEWVSAVGSSKMKRHTTMRIDDIGVRV